MRKLILLCSSLCAMLLLVSVSPVRAQSVAWVAANGSGSTCTQTSPCATFALAVATGASQINCLNSGSYGPVTITASITIDCGTGNMGNVVVSLNNAITINSGSAATIVLRHLSLNGLGTADFGINTQSFPSGTLIVEDCLVQGFQNVSIGEGIRFTPTSGRGLLQVSHSQIIHNTDGIVVRPSSGQIASVTLNGVEVTGNSNSGVALTGSGVVAGTMRDSVAGQNGVTGVVAAATQVFFTIEESSIVANLVNGVVTSSAGSVVNVGASTIGANGTGVNAASGSIISFGNNQMSANGSNGNFTSTTTLR